MIKIGFDCCNHYFFYPSFSLSFYSFLTPFIKDLGYVLVVLNLSVPEISGVDDSMMMSS